MSATLTQPGARRQRPLAPTVADRRHGHARASDRGAVGIGEEPLPQPIRGRRPAGVALIGVALLGLITGLGVLRVRTKARGLELGAAISELTHEHNRLLDEKRRLEAERAYLRHPDHIQRVAIERLHMEPVQPERIQAITVRPRPPEASPQP